MEEQFLIALGEYIKLRVRKAIKDPNRARYTKMGRIPKNPPRYNTYASGKLYNSVDYRVLDGLIYLFMEDYGVDYVFNDLLDEQAGSFPGQGRWAKDTRAPEAKGTTSPLLNALMKWIVDKGIPTTNVKGMAFAIRKNMFKAGWAGTPLFTPDVNRDILNESERLLGLPEYQGFVINNILDRFTLLSKSSAQFNLGINL
jgi:hypothetical protein